VIDEAIYALLSSGSPPTPAIPTWYANAAAEGTEAPYGVFTRYGNPQILTQDRQTVTRQWRYRFVVYHASALVAAQQMLLLQKFLVGHTDSPAAGIMCFIALGGQGEYLQKQRYHGFVSDFAITENIP
jgi:hypothetical protein